MEASLDVAASNAKNLAESAAVADLTGCFLYYGDGELIPFSVAIRATI
jgi:hypothetical protein